MDAAVTRERSGRQGHNAARLAKITGIERSRVSRLTQELRALHYLERRDSGVLCAGDRYFQIAAALNEPWLRKVRASLRRLASQLRMNALVTVADGPRALLVRCEIGVGAADAAIHPGMATPTWCTGAGRALLWDHSRADLETLLSNVQFVGVGGPAAARSIAQVHALLERDREEGVIVAREEYVEGIDQYALPIRDTTGIVASIAVSGPRRGKTSVRQAKSALRDAVAGLAADAAAS